MAKRLKKLITRKAYTSADFFLEDYSRTLFPLRTNRILVENGSKQLLEFASALTKSPEQADGLGISFLPQKRVFAMKAGWHLRRTTKLDPIAEFFLYDLVFRNRALFRKSFVRDRECFGYRFLDGKPLDAASSYRGFKGAQRDYAKKYKFGLSFDVASYFNSIYHHDLVAWFDERGASESDVSSLASFFGRQILVAA